MSLATLTINRHARNNISNASGVHKLLEEVLKNAFVALRRATFALQRPFFALSTQLRMPTSGILRAIAMMRKLRSTAGRPQIRFGSLAQDDVSNHHTCRLSLTGPLVQFVDETPDVEGYYLSDSESQSHWQQVDGSPNSHIGQVTDFGSNVSPMSHTRAIEISGGDGASAVSRDTPRNYGPIPHGSTLGLANVGTVPYPLTENHEVRLMQYYLTYMCTWVRHSIPCLGRRAVLIYRSSIFAIPDATLPTSCPLEQRLARPSSMLSLPCPPGISA